MAAAFASISSLRGERYDGYMYGIIIFSSSALLQLSREVKHVLLPLPAFYRAALMNTAHPAPAAHGTTYVYVHRAKELQDAPWMFAVGVYCRQQHGIR